MKSSTELTCLDLKRTFLIELPFTVEASGTLSSVESLFLIQFSCCSKALWVDIYKSLAKEIPMQKSDYLTLIWKCQNTVAKRQTAFREDDLIEVSFTEGLRAKRQEVRQSFRFNYKNLKTRKYFPAFTVNTFFFFINIVPHLVVTSDKVAALSCYIFVVVSLQVNSINKWIHFLLITQSSC